MKTLRRKKSPKKDIKKHPVHHDGDEDKTPFLTSLVEENRQDDYIEDEASSIMSTHKPAALMSEANEDLEMVHEELTKKYEKEIR